MIHASLNKECLLLSSQLVALVKLSCLVQEIILTRNVTYKKGV